MEETLSNRICRPAGDVCAVLHINWQQSSRNAWLEIPQRAPGMTSPRSRMPGDLGISPPSRLNYSTRNSFLQCWALSRLLCNSVSIQQTSVLSTQNPPSLVHGWVLCPQGARTTRADLSQGPGPQLSPRPVDPSPRFLYWSSSSGMAWDCTPLTANNLDDLYRPSPLPSTEMFPNFSLLPRSPSLTHKSILYEQSLLLNCSEGVPQLLPLPSPFPCPLSDSFYSPSTLHPLKGLTLSLTVGGFQKKEERFFKWSHVQTHLLSCLLSRVILQC